MFAPGFATRLATELAAHEAPRLGSDEASSATSHATPSEAPNHYPFKGQRVLTEHSFHCTVRTQDFVCFKKQRKSDEYAKAKTEQCKQNQNDSRPGIQGGRAGGYIPA